MYSIVQGDFRRLNCPSEAALVFTDPPFGIGKEYGGVKEIAPLSYWVQEVLKWSCAPRTVIMAHWSTMPIWMPLIPAPTRMLVWHRTFLKPQKGLRSFIGSVTPILVYEQDAPWYGPDYNDRDWHDCIDAIGSYGDVQRMRRFGIKIKHPAIVGTSFPGKVMRGYVQKGDLVVDPMCGAGSILVAALRKGCDVWGCDTVYSYCEFAKLWLMHEARLVGSIGS